MKGVFAISLAAVLLVVSSADASNLTQVLPITDRVIMCHFDDGYVTYRTYSQGLSDIIYDSPLDTTDADVVASYQIYSFTDPNYSPARTPVKVGRKTKGQDFPNWPPASVKEHWVCLELPYPMQRGTLYRIYVGDLADNLNSYDLVYDEYSCRSEAIHTNQIGYVPSARMKYAYVSHWIGGINGNGNNLWPLELEDYAGTPFHLVDVNSGSTVFSGTLVKRKDFETGPGDTGFSGDPEPSNYNQADVWQCDFSSFQTPGEYRIVIERIGCSYPFKIADHTYAGPFYLACRGLYHQRSGPARGLPWTNWPKDIDHTPGVNGFKVVYTTWNYMTQGEGVGAGNMGSPAYTTEWAMPTNPAPWMGPDWGWGGYFDAGDWDRRTPHLEIPQELLMVYEIFPEKFYDGQLNIPESGNGSPDIIDEARWTIDFFRRLTGPTGGVSAGIECNTPTSPDNSATDRYTTWYAYKEDPQVTMLTAAGCAQLAHCLELAGDTSEKSDLISDAEAFYNWAVSASGIQNERMLAAAWLYKVTGNNAYQNQYKTDNNVTSSTSSLGGQEMAVCAYVTTDQPGIDTTLKNTQIQACYNWADSRGLSPAQQRSCRMAGYIWTPTVVGAITTTPQVRPLVIAYHLSGGDQTYLDYIYTSCDYVLGGNALNMAYITGAGTYGAERTPQHAVCHDAYTDGVAPIIPGIVLYGPMNCGFAESWSTGHFSSSHAVYLTFWPSADPTALPYVWPTHELYTDNPYTIMNNEFTVVQNIGPSAAVYGFLWALTGQPADFSDDNDVDFQDYAYLAEKWLDGNCDYDNDWCGLADLDLTGGIDRRDIKAFGDRWKK